MDKPLNARFDAESMEVFAQEDAADTFLAGEVKEDFVDDLLLANVEVDEDDTFKREGADGCGDLDDNVLVEAELNGNDSLIKDDKNMIDYKRFRRNSLVNALKKRSIKCLNKMHVMEDVQEGSDVPGAQPSSPGHAEQRSDVEEQRENADSRGELAKEMEQANGAGESKTELQEANSTDEPEKHQENGGAEAAAEKESSTEAELNSVPEDAGSDDSQYSKRKTEADESPVTKRMRSELEQNYILRDKILNEFMEAAGCSSLQQLQLQMDQILAEIRTLNELAREKEKEWNNIIHLKKIKEELLLRMQRRKQVMVLNSDKMDWSEHDASPEPQADILEERLRHPGHKQSLLKHNVGAKNSGLVIYSTSSSSPNPAFKNSGEPVTSGGKQKSSASKQFPSTVIEINGQTSDLKQQNRQRPVLDVQSIIADYRQRHPEAVPRRGRRIRSLLNTQGSGSQVKHNLNAAGVEANSELGLLLTAVDSAKQTNPKSASGDGLHVETTSFKDVLMQFAKLSQNERQDLLQGTIKTPPYSEVTVHPVPAHSQSGSNSLLHGILTKTQSRPDNSKSTFSPTLARLLTAPERAAASSPHTNNHGGTPPVSIADMLSNNKARNEITITPVGGQYEITTGKEKAATEEEEAEDSADRLVIDESDALDARNRIDNGSDAGDEVPQCQGCNQKPAQFVCAGCGNQWYCSRECQVMAWDEHSEVCSG